MRESQLKRIADGADMIVRGYAFTRKDDKIAVLNLNCPTSAMLLSNEGKMLESSMDEIEQALVMRIWAKDAGYMEAQYA